MSDTNENQVNPITVTDQEVDQWIGNLTEADKAELRRQQLLSRALARAEPKPEPNVALMSDQEFAAYKRSLGIG